MTGVLTRGGWILRTLWLNEYVLITGHTNIFRFGLPAYRFRYFRQDNNYVRILYQNLVARSSGNKQGDIVGALCRFLNAPVT